MTDKNKQEMIGTLVRSVAGHDIGEYYIIVQATEKECFVANGKERTVVSPKRKNKKHLKPVEADYDREIQKKLQAGEKVREEEIRKLIRNFKRESITCQKRMSSKSKAQ